MKRRPQTKTRHTPRAQRPRAIALVALCVALASAACQHRTHTDANTTDASHTLHDPPAAHGAGTLVIHNHSDYAITRVWLSPHHEENLEVGASPKDFAHIAPNEHATVHTDSGWWNLWLEADNGHDALLYHTWIAPDEPTTLHIDNTWWVQGDWIQHEDLLVDDPTREDPRAQ